MNAIKSVVMGLLCTLALGGGSAFGRTIIVPGDYATVAEAVANAEKDDIIQLADDTHLLTGTLVVEADVTIRGSSYEKCILKQTTAKVTVVTLNSPNAKLENLTVTGASGNPYYMHGAGVQIASNGGNISGCMISNNCFTGVVDYGGGICVEGPAVIENSHIVRNQAGGMNHGSFGGGIYLGADAQVIVDNCLIADNTCDGNGGGIDAQFSQKQNAVVRNCTIANNWSYNAGGGVYVYNTKSLYLYNCLIAANRAENDSGDGKPNWALSTTTPAQMATRAFNCLYGDEIKAVLGDSATCLVGNAGFKSVTEGDYHLTVLSDAIGKASPAYSTADDLDGVARDASPDIGCYEYDAGAEPFSCLAGFAPARLFKDQPVTLTSSLVNPPADFEPVYTWSFSNTVADTKFSVTVSGASYVLDQPGIWQVSLVVSDAGGKCAPTAPYVCEDLLTTAVRTNYVTAADLATSAYPYDSPANAATCLNAVIPYLIDKSVVLLDAGRHRTTGTVTLGVDAVVKGAGRDVTIVEPADGVVARVFSINSANAVVRSLTIAGGRSPSYWVNGMGVDIGSNGGTVEDCRIEKCLIDQRYCNGVAVYVAGAKACVDRCVIAANTNASPQSSRAAVYVASGSVRNCLVTDNTNGVDTVCTVFLADGAVFDNCTVYGNSGADSVAVSSSMSSSGWLRNCIVGGHAMGASEVSDDTHGYPNWSLDNAAGRNRVQNCCWIGSDDLGASCADADKVAFVNEAEGDFRLRIDSSCRDAGVATNWQPGIGDLDGNPRVFHKGKIDIGCYECQEVMGLQMLVR